MASMLDFDLALLRDVVSVLDDRITQLAAESVRVPDPDAWGYFDRIEHTTGLGFVACQTYLTSVRGHLSVQRKTAWALGPQHLSGTPIAAAVNDAANYWKHRDEWVMEGPATRQERIRTTFEEVGFPVASDYPLSGILTEIAGASFRVLVDSLVGWRDAMPQTPS